MPKWTGEAGMKSEKALYRRQGYKNLGLGYGGYKVTDRAQWLKPYCKRGRYNDYFPVLLADYLYYVGVPECLSAEIAMFLGLSPQKQKEHVEGLQLAHDCNKEEPVNFGDDEVPF